MSLPEAKPVSPPDTLEYSRTVNYVFENPNWLTNLLWMFLGQFAASIIPIVPQIVVMGYQFEVFDGLLESRGTRHPDFNINRLADYLARGLWPFLAMFVMAIGWGFVFIFFVLISIGCIAGAAAIGGNDAGPILGTVAGLFMVVLVLMLIALLFFVITPVAVRAGITRDFAAAFDMSWIKDFVAKMWMEILLSTMVLLLVVLVLVTVTCGLATFIVAPLIPMVQAHLWYQFYVLYLGRGGIPVAVKAIAFPGTAAPPPGTY